MNKKVKIDLEGYVGIITGSASGIGKNIALKLAKNGAKIVLADINYDEICKVKDKIDLCSNSLALKTDVTLQKDVKKLVGKTIESYGKIDFLINNAGIVGPYNFDDTEEEDWERVFNVNVKSMFLCSKHVLPIMKKQNSGKIIFIGSTNASKPGGYVIPYRASKAAVVMLAKSLALYAAPYNININAICPGVVLTEIQKNMIKEVIKNKEMSFQDYVETRAKKVPLGRFTKTEDVADLAEFLISDSSKFITGQGIYVNGGEWST